MVLFLTTANIKFLTENLRFKIGEQHFDIVIKALLNALPTKIVDTKGCVECVLSVVHKLTLSLSLSIRFRPRLGLGNFSQTGVR